MTEHVKHLINCRFYIDPNLTQKEVKHLTSQIIKHQGSVSGNSNSSSVTHFVVVNDAKKKTGVAIKSKEKKLLHSKHLVELAMSKGLQAFTVDELESKFEECMVCKEDKYNQIKSQLDLEKKTGKMPGLPFILISDVFENYNPLMKVFKKVSEIPKLNFEAPPGYCVLQSTHNNSTKNEYRYCECCQERFVDQNKHFFSKKHMNFAQDQLNYKGIDAFMEYLHEKEANKNTKITMETTNTSTDSTNITEEQQKTLIDSSERTEQEESSTQILIKKEPFVMESPDMEEVDMSELDTISQKPATKKRKLNLVQLTLDNYKKINGKKVGLSDNEPKPPPSPIPIRSRKKKKKIKIMEIE